MYDINHRNSGACDSCWGSPERSSYWWAWFVSFTSWLLLSVHLPASRLGVNSVFTWWIINALLQHKCAVCISRGSSSVLLYNKLYALSEAEQHVMTTSSLKVFSYLKESCHWLTVWDDRNMDFQLSKLLLKTFFSHQSKSLCIQLETDFWQREKWEMTARTSSGRDCTRWGSPIHLLASPSPLFPAPLFCTYGAFKRWATWAHTAHSESL